MGDDTGTSSTPKVGDDVTSLFAEQAPPGPPAPRQPVAARGTRGTPPYISDDTQRFLGGAVGAGLAGMGAEALLPAGAITAATPWALRAATKGASWLMSPAGAYAGGATAAALQGAPPGEINEAGTEQALWEVAGKGTALGVKAIGKRAIASRVGRYAATAIDNSRAAIGQQLDLALQQAESAFRGVKEGVIGAYQRTVEGVRGARAAVPAAEAAAERHVAQARAAWPAHTPPPGSLSDPATAGRLAAGVIEGPAKSSKQALGEAVGEAARTGPELDFTTMQEKLQQKVRGTKTSWENAAADQAAEEAAAHAGPPGVPDDVAAMLQAQPKGGSAGPSPSVLQQRLQALKEAGVLDEAAMEPEKARTLRGALGRIETAPDAVNFEDAHILKRALDESGIRWDRTAPTQIRQITKATRNDLRRLMSSHEPYNQATEAYQAVSRLHDAKFATAIRKNALEAPETITQLIKPNNPTRLDMLHDLIVNQAAEGGGAAEGQTAWESLRSAWTHEQLIAPGIDKFTQTLEQLQSTTTGQRFLQRMYGDAQGQQMIGHLQQISTAAQDALATGERMVAEAKAAVPQAQAAQQVMQGRNKLRVMRARTDLQTVKAGVGAAQKATPEVKAFEKSGLRNAPTPGQLTKDLGVLGAVSAVTGGGALGLGAGVGVAGASAFGGASLYWIARHEAAKRLMASPQMADLIKYASHSPLGTRLIVQALGSPAPGMMIADLMRWYGIFDAQSELRANQAPPAVSTGAATPPPGPPQPSEAQKLQNFMGGQPSTRWGKYLVGQDLQAEEARARSREQTAKK